MSPSPKASVARSPRSPSASEPAAPGRDLYSLLTDTMKKYRKAIKEDDEDEDKDKDDEEWK